MIHTVKGFSIVKEAEVDVLLEFSCFFYDPTDVGNLVFGSSEFSKSILNIWKFSVQVLMKAGLKDFSFRSSLFWILTPYLIGDLQIFSPSLCFACGVSVDSVF